MTMPPRATLLLYTDGLVERRRESLDHGIARAADVVQDNGGTALETWPTRSWPGSRPATATRTTSPCCSTASRRRWRWSSPPRSASWRPAGPPCAAG